MSFILVIDIGTSSMKGMLYNINGEIQKNVKVDYQPDYSGDNIVEQDPLDWKNALFDIVKTLVVWTKERNTKIDGISITSQRTSIIPVDKAGKPLRKAIMWQDRRAISVCEELERHANYVYKLTGSKINPVFTAPKITWLKQREPEIYHKAHKIIVIPDYIIYLMTGKFVTDYTYGSRTSMMNIKEKKWDENLLKLFQIDLEKLSDLVPQGSIVGHTTDEFYMETGLPASTPIISAGGDQQCAALGAGVIDEGSIQISSGTGSFILASSNELQLDAEMRVICNVSAIPGKYILEASILTTSTIVSWYADNFYEKSEEISAIEKMLDEAAGSPVGSNGLIMLPYFQGRGSPDWNTLAKGTFHNVSLESTRADFARSILESIALEISENIDVIEEVLQKPQDIKVGGGLTKSALFNQIQADVYNNKISLPSNTEVASLGAWVSATVALSIYPSFQVALDKAKTGLKSKVYLPNKKNHIEYNEVKDNKKALYKKIIK